MCFSILLNLLSAVTVSIPYDWYMGNGTSTYSQFTKYFCIAKKFHSGQISFKIAATIPWAFCTESEGVTHVIARSVALC